jgi:glutamate dehydrogenase/leucine dehydrogenase
MFDGRIEAWGGEEVVTRFDEASDTWMFIGVHSTVRGPAMGGTRMKTYTDPADALADVLRLSNAMTMKQAAADLPFGGGKAVLALPRMLASGSRERLDLLRRYGDLVDALHGTYVTAADMNTGEDDMDVIGEVTEHVLGRSHSHGGSGDPSTGTALGVFHSVRAACRRAFGTDDLRGRSVLVQGVGSVGAPLARHLADAGAAVRVADLDEARARSTGFPVVAAGEEIGTTCDVFSPCATGGMLSAETIPRLRCVVVAGAANNQLASPGDDRRLADAGILYAPDYIVNAGGVTWLTGYERLGWDDATMQARLAAIGTTLEQIFDDADAAGITPAEAADRLALGRLEATAADPP